MSGDIIRADNVLQPASGEEPRQLVILLHGYGTNGADLMPLATVWSNLLPHAEFISPNAPAVCDGPFGFFGAYQWFSLDEITPDSREERIREVAPLLNHFIDEQLAQRGLTDKQLALVGFSQGTIMSLFVAFRRKRPCAGILGYSGRLAGAESLATEITSRPPAFLLHGANDEVIPVSELHNAARNLKQLEVPLLAYAIPQLGHGINEEMVDMGGQFLQHCLTTPATDLQAFAQTLGTPLRH